MDEQQVLHREEFMTGFARLREGGVQTRSCDTFATPRPRTMTLSWGRRPEKLRLVPACTSTDGDCHANNLVTCATLVSAISYVNTPQTPLPWMCTSSMTRVAVSPVHPEEPLQHVDDELHRGVVVVEQHHLVQRRLLDLGRGLLHHDAGVAFAFLVWIVPLMLCIIARRYVVNGVAGPRHKSDHATM